AAGDLDEPTCPDRPGPTVSVLGDRPQTATRLQTLAKSKRVRGLAAILVSGTLAAVVAVLYRFDPARVSFYPACAFHLLTGLHCPGCGATRALHQLLHGHLGEAFRYNPLLIIALPYLGYTALSESRRVVGRRPWPQPFRSSRSVWAIFALVMIFWFLRNLPMAPFSWLAP
ncbi:MAG: DUF2752 domain-containing protein, partial [Isosphaeraceae bacterium]